MKGPGLFCMLWKITLMNTGLRAERAFWGEQASKRPARSHEVLKVRSISSKSRETTKTVCQSLSQQDQEDQKQMSTDLVAITIRRLFIGRNVSTSITTRSKGQKLEEPEIFESLCIYIVSGHVPVRLPHCIVQSCVLDLQSCINGSAYIYNICTIF